MPLQDEQKMQTLPQNISLEDHVSITVDESLKEYITV